MSRAALDPMIGAQIGGRYEVVRRIAKGGMGTIYEVRNTRIGRSFALKMLTAEAAEDPEVLGRFRREAEVVARLRHPNIVEVVDWDTLDDGAPFLVMEYLRGEPLSTRLRRGGALGWPALALIADQVFAALSVAHRAGVVHRDLKPDNIFLTIDDEGEERTKLLDFGISKLRDSKTFATTDSRVLGTPAYMAPEQAEGHHDEIGPGTDVWAMGAIIYEMATGKVAFDAPSTPAILYRVCHGEPVPLIDLRPDAPAGVPPLITRALTRAIRNRPSDIEAVRAELRAALRDVDGVTWSEPLRTRLATPLPRAAMSPAPPRDRDDTVADPPAAAPASAASAAELQVNTVSDRKPVRWEKPLIGGLLFAGALVAAFIAVRGTTGDDPEPPPAPATALVATEVPEPVTPPAPPAAPTMIDLTIESKPAGAEVYRLPSELKVGTTPWKTSVERADGTAVFLLRKRGHVDERVEVDLRVGGVVRGKLDPVKVHRKPRDRDRNRRRRGEPVDPFGGG